MRRHHVLHFQVLPPQRPRPQWLGRGVSSTRNFGSVISSYVGLVCSSLVGPADRRRLEQLVLFAKAHIPQEGSGETEEEILEHRKWYWDNIALALRGYTPSEFFEVSAKTTLAHVLTFSTTPER